VIRKHRIPASWRHLVPAMFVAGVAVGPLVGIWSSWVMWAWGAAMGAYFVAVLAASVQSARRYGWDLLPVLPVVFGAYHFSYGSGFLMGLMSGGAGESVTRVTR
jgi:succinoglycan biosynthesis protein ExoA